MSSQFALFKTRRFAPLFCTQFLGAFNDNLYKNALVVLVTFQAAQWTTMKPEILANLAAGIFIAPYFFFSATAGQLADKYDKAGLARLSKGLEIVIMLLVSAGFWLTNLYALLAALFLLGAQATLFGPVKYAILPQHLSEHELVGGNAMVEAGTFVAILMGTLAGGMLAGAAGQPVWIALFGLMVALLGYFASLWIPRAPAPEPGLKINFNIVSETWRNIRATRKNRTVFLSILGISWFWLYGALFLAQFPAYTRHVLGGTETVVTLLLATFTIGIGVGSLLCERLSGKHVEIGLVPLGSIGLTLFAFDLGWATPLPPPPGVSQTLMELMAKPEIWRVLADLTLMGVFGGFFTVPLYALMQIGSAEETRARTIATNNIINALFMVLGALVASAFLLLGISLPQLFMLAALFNALVAAYIYGLLPEFLHRFGVWVFLHASTQLECEGVEQHVPAKGGAMVTFERQRPVDLLAIMAGCRRPVRFVIDAELMNTPLLGFMLRKSRAIVRSPSLAQDHLLEQIRAALAEEDLVGIPVGEGGNMANWLTQNLAGVPLVSLGLKERPGKKLRCGFLRLLVGRIFRSAFPPGMTLTAGAVVCANNADQ